MVLTLFKQGNYPNDYLGKSKVSIAKAGCLTCSITGGYDSLFNKTLNPPTIASKLQYDLAGILQWPSVSNWGLKLELRSSVPNDSAVNEALLNPNKFAILEINHGAHFVLVIGRKLPLLGYRIYDPFYGDKAYRYNSVVTGCRILAKV